MRSPRSLIYESGESVGGVWGGKVGQDSPNLDGKLRDVEFCIVESPLNRVVYERRTEPSVARWWSRWIGVVRGLRIGVVGSHSECWGVIMVGLVETNLVV